MTVDSSEGFLLSPQQEAIAEAMTEGAEPLTLILKVTGHLTLEGLRAAVGKVAAWHEILRTRFEKLGGARITQQVVLPACAARFSSLSLAPGLSPVEQLIQETDRTVFDRESGFTCQFTLCRESEQVSYLGVTLDSMTADWASFAILMSELADAFDGKAAREGELFQYADYATWQTDCREWSREGRKQPESTLPSLFREGARVPGDYSVEFRCLNDEPGADSRCLAACVTVVGRLTGASRLVLGVTCDGRSENETRKMLGPTEKTIPFEAEIDQTFGQLITHFRDWKNTTVDVIDRHFPEFERQPEVRFQMIRLPESVACDAWKAEPQRLVDRRTLRERLRFLGIRIGGRLQLQIRTDAALANESARDFANTLGSYLKPMLEGEAEFLDRKLGAIPLGEPDSRLLHPIEVSSFPSVLAMIGQRVRENPASIAISHLGAEMSYRELWDTSEKVAKELLKRGLRPGDVVGIHGAKCIGLIVAMLGTLLSGGVLLMLDPALPEERRVEMCRTAGIRSLLCVGPGSSISADGSIPVIRINATGVLSEEASAPVPSMLFGEAAHDSAYVFFTSGTTGTPKAVVGSHRGLAHFIVWEGIEFSVTAGDRVAFLTGLSFDVLLRDVFLPLCHGGVLCLPPPDAMGIPLVMLEWMGREGITILHLVPSIVDWWLSGDQELPHLQALRLALFAGEPLKASLVKRWRKRVSPSAEIINLYGPTETTLAKCFHRVPEQPEEGVQPIGQPLPGTEIHLWNSENQVCMTGEPGEILIRTPYRTLGPPHGTFFSNPLRQDAGDILYRTGDLGCRRLNGDLDILGRIDDQVKIRGVRVSPREIEAIISSHSEIGNCAVLASKDEMEETPILIAFVTREGEGRLDPSELLCDLRLRLPHAMVPDKLFVLEKFPLTVNGKVDRDALRKIGASGKAGPHIIGEPPRDEIQRMMLGLWHDLFQRRDFGVTDHFFDLGGHSLLAAQLIARLRKAFHRPLPLGVIFESPTVERLTSRLNEFPTEAEPVISSPAAAEGTAPLSPSQRRIWFQHKLEPDGGNYHLPVTVRLTGTLDIDRLRQSLNFLVDRHAILRSIFTEEDGYPAQMALPHWEIDMPLQDLSDLPANERNQKVGAIATDEAQRPFHLGSVPSTRFRLIKTGPKEHILLINFHHLVGDGWSSVLFLRELGIAYQNAPLVQKRDGGWSSMRPCLVSDETGSDRNGPACPSLPPLPYQYADFSRWEQVRHQLADHSSQLAYWEKRMAGASAVPPFPTDTPRPVNPVHPSGEVSLRLSEALSDRIRQLGRDQSATLFMTLLAAFQAFLHRITGLEDVIIGTPIANRPSTESENLIGCFINTLPLRSQPRGEMTFRDFLEDTRRNVLADFKHQECQFEEIVRVARPGRRANVHPLFQVLLNVLNFDPLPQVFDELRMERVFLAVPRSNFDWTVYVREGPRIEIQFLYNISLFDPGRMEARAVGFREFLQQVTERSEGTISDFRVESVCRISGGSEPELEAVKGANGVVFAENVRVFGVVRAAWDRSLSTGQAPGLDDNFFEMGGHSMMAMAMCDEIGRELGVIIPLRWMFEHPTIRSFSNQIGYLVWNLGAVAEGDESFEI
jgi:amino acid adenylation domain-containing protein